MKLVTALVVLAIAASGCGGGKSSSTTTSSAAPSITAANYKTVLSQVVTQVQTLASSPPSHPSPAESASFTLTLQNAVQQARDQLARLHPPGVLASRNRVLVDALTKYAELLGQLATAAKKSDAAGVKQITAAIRTETINLKTALQGAGG